MSALLSTPARQAAIWAVVGILGLLFAGGGVWLALDDGDNGGAPSAGTTAEPTATPTRRAASMPSATPTPASMTPQPEPSPAATVQPQQQASAGASQPTPTPALAEPTAEPTPEPTQEPVVSAGGPYCVTTSATATPTRVLGTVTIGGVAAPAGTVVTLAFDGIAGPSEAVTISGATAGYSIDFNAAQGACANRVGAAIGAYVDGIYVPSGQSVGGAAGQAGFIRFDIALP